MHQRSFVLVWLLLLKKQVGYPGFQLEIIRNFSISSGVLNGDIEPAP